MGVDAVNSLSSGKGNGTRSPRGGLFQVRCGTLIAMHAKAHASNRMAKVNGASHGPRVSPHIQAKVTVRK